MIKSGNSNSSNGNGELTQDEINKLLTEEQYLLQCPHGQDNPCGKCIICRLTVDDWDGWRGGLSMEEIDALLESIKKSNQSDSDCKTFEEANALLEDNNELLKIIGRNRKSNLDCKIISEENINILIDACKNFALTKCRLTWEKKNNIYGEEIYIGKLGQIDAFSIRKAEKLWVCNFYFDPNLTKFYLDTDNALFSAKKNAEKIIDKWIKLTGLKDSE